MRQSLIFPKALQDGFEKFFVYVVLVAFVWAREEWSDQQCLNGVTGADEAVNWDIIYFFDTLLCTSFIIFFVEKLNDAELPPKRTILKKDFEYLSSIRLKLQEYLQVKYL